MAQLPGRLTIRPIAAGEGWQVRDLCCTLGPQDRVAEEIHSRFSISVVLAGMFSYDSGRDRWLLTPGSLLLGNAGACFRCHHDHGAGDRCLSFQFDAALMESLAPRSRATQGAVFRRNRIPPIAATLPLWQPLQRLAQRADGIASERLAIEQLAFDVAAQVLAIDAGTEHGRVRARDEARVARVIRVMESDPAAEHTLASLARQAALSRHHFLRSFRSVTGVTPYRYLLNRRMALAAQRLREDSASVLQIAMETGFADLSEFTRRFKANFGQPPAAWRARILRGGGVRMLA